MYRTWCVLFVLPLSNSSEFINIRSECSKQWLAIHRRILAQKSTISVHYQSYVWTSSSKTFPFSMNHSIEYTIKGIHWGPDTVSPSENLHASWVGSSEIECIMKLWDNTSNDRINIRRLQNSLNGRNKTGNSKSNESEHGFPIRTQWWFWSGRSF